MKTIKRLIVTTAFIAAICVLNAQSPPPPNGGNNPTGGNTPVGGGAPIGSGIVLLITLAAGYGGKKVFDFGKRKLAE
ncbi:MAG: hypothetical protein ACOYMF_15925 [Bacteroidales bacterium]